MKTMFRRDVATSSGRQKWAANCSTQRSESQYDILKSLYELGDLQDGRSIAAGLQVISADGSDWGSALVRVALEALLTVVVL
ncbi:MAG: hypothetical protein ACLP2U_04760 [Syntrophobacteraceae bacterium]